MKKFSIIMAFLAIVIFCGFILIQAAEVTTTRKIEWEQDQATFDAMDHWELLWGDAAGGPYVKITNIGKPTTPPVGGIYTLPEITLIVEGQMGKTVTKYFVIEAVMADGERSGFSNEALSDFKIAMGVPFTLKVNVITQGN